MNAWKIKARIISAGANVPVSREAEDELALRPSLCLPDFVVNCGGVLGTYLEIAGLHPKEVACAIRNIVGPQIEKMVRAFEGGGKSLRDLAVEKAEANFLRVKKSVEGGGFGAIFNPSVLRLGRSVLPSRIVGRMAVGYFEKAVARN
jgi:glutamate dehydrogenase/leucine dehydrogenase